MTVTWTVLRAGRIVARGTVDIEPEPDGFDFTPATAAAMRHARSGDTIGLSWP